jgi:hypothetical protein
MDGLGITGRDEEMNMDRRILSNIYKAHRRVSSRGYQNIGRKVKEMKSTNVSK